MAPKKKLSFEESTARLEEIVSLLERGEMCIRDSCSTVPPI